MLTILSFMHRKSDYPVLSDGNRIYSVGHAGSYNYIIFKSYEEAYAYDKAVLRGNPEYDCVSYMIVDNLGVMTKHGVENVYRSDR